MERQSIGDKRPESSFSVGASWKPTGSRMVVTGTGPTDGLEVLWVTGTRSPAKRQLKGSAYVFSRSQSTCFRLPGHGICQGYLMLYIGRNF